MSIQTVEGFECGKWGGKPLEVEAIEENLTSDGGLFVFSQLDEKPGWTVQFSKMIFDQRTDTLRTDPVFRMIAGRVPRDMHLASQPTISRLENSVTAANLLEMQDWFIERFLDSFTTPPERITLHIDTMDDPTHGQQQLTFFHGYYKLCHFFQQQPACGDYKRTGCCKGSLSNVSQLRNAWRKSKPQQGTEV